MNRASGPVAAALAALLFLGAVPAQALARLAVLFANNTGLEDEPPLQYATRDARAVHAALAQLGGVDKGGSYLLLDLPAAKVKAALYEAKERIRALHKQGQQVQLLIYYSGHGSGDAMHLNGEKLPLSWVREYFGGLEADVKILVADACYSGSLMAGKGAALEDPVPVKYYDDLKVNGSAILTSSSAGELSQESKELQGSLFTHYLLTALRGAADFDKDGQVSLWEAYNYSQAAVRRKLASVRNALQNPEFDMDIHGSETVVLTRLDMGQAFLTLKGLPQGRYQVMDAVNSQQVAEVEMLDADGVMLALPRSPYYVYHPSGGREGGGVNGLVGYADLRKAKVVSLDAGDFRPASAGPLSAKGMPRWPFPDRQAYQLSLQPRWYPGFPGRKGTAMALEVSAERSLRSWGFLGAFGYLPRYREESSGNRLIQEGLGGSGEVRYYRGLPQVGFVFLGPRLEFWSLDQSANGQQLGRGNLLGSLGVFGVEKTLPRSLAFTLALEAGYFWSYDQGGRRRRDAVFPISMALRYGR